MKTQSITMCGRARWPVRWRAWAGAVLWLLAQAAWGHAALLGSTPAAGQTLVRMPADASLMFNEPVQPQAWQLVGPGGQRWPLAPNPEDGAARWRVALPPVSEPGAYILNWRVVSNDGHPVGGAVNWVVGTAHAAPAPRVEAAASWSLRDGAIWALRWVILSGLLAGAGLALARLWPGRTGTRMGGRGWVLPLAAIASLLPALGLQGLDVLDAPWAAIWRADTWRAAWSTTQAYSLAGVAASLCLALWAVRGGRGAAAAALAAVACAGAALAVSGHAASAPPAWVARPVVWVHVVAAILWVGALLPLWLALRHDGDASEAALRRFSRGVPLVLWLLLGSGLVLLVLQWGGLPMLWQSRYGQLLLLKLALVAVLLSLGAWNRWWLLAGRSAGAEQTERRPLARQADRRALSRVLVCEMLLALMVLGVVSAWRLTPPPRSVMQQASDAVWQPAPAPRLYQAAAAGGAQVEAAWVMAAAGTPGEVDLFLSDRHGAPLYAQAVRVVFRQPQTGLGPVVFDAAADADGLWRVREVVLPDVDGWHMQVEVLVSDFDRLRFSLVWPSPVVAP